MKFYYKNTPLHTQKLALLNEAPTSHMQKGLCPHLYLGKRSSKTVVKGFDTGKSGHKQSPAHPCKSQELQD